MGDELARVFVVWFQSRFLRGLARYWKVRSSVWEAVVVVDARCQMPAQNFGDPAVGAVDAVGEPGNLVE